MQLGIDQPARNPVLLYILTLTRVTSTDARGEGHNFMSLQPFFFYLPSADAHHTITQ